MNIFVLLIFAIFSFNYLYCFNLSSGRWANGSATVLFSTTMAAQNAQELNAGQWIVQDKTAFERWTTTEGVKFDITYSAEDCGDNCTIGNGKSEMYWMDSGVEPINIPAGALAVTLRRQYENNFLEVDFIINKNFDKAFASPGSQSVANGLCVLSNNTYSNCFDFPSIATHEIGHFFGLDHSSEDSGLSATDPRRLATMFYSLAANGLLIPLQTDDIAGISCLYPTTGEPYKVASCCESFNPFDRAPGCSHSFSNAPDAQSLDVGGNTSGCGYIKDSNSNSSSNIFLMILIPMAALLSYRMIFGRRKRA